LRSSNRVSSCLIYLLMHESASALKTVVGLQVRATIISNVNRDLLYVPPYSYGAALSVASRQSVCLSARTSVHPIFSKLESRRNVWFSRNIALDKSKYREANLRSKGQTVRCLRLWYHYQVFRAL